MSNSAAIGTRNETSTLHLSRTSSYSMCIPRSRVNSEERERGLKTQAHKVFGVDDHENEQLVGGRAIPPALASQKGPAQ